ncbi:hypothetical protein JKP88DRAFT_301516 [Tribonema minus]|uniref:Uncharacterized protein n=1 Tax=Tribonema minus TaxID=303371 RepID=A0A835ZFI1_9STRA|nr:hypothetical protein JKP88DRAFT_301516 [Tribonema minus]
MVAVSTTTFPFLHATFKVGSCRGSLNHISFSKDDVPPKARARHDEVVMWKSRRTLPAGRQTWNHSVELPPYPALGERANLQGGSSCLYKHNYRAEVLPESPLPHVPRPTKFDVSVAAPTSSPPRSGARPYSMTEMPVHPSLASRVAWNACAVLTPAEKRRRYETLMTRSNANTARRAKGGDAPRATLAQRTQAKLEETRALKTAGTFSAGRNGGLNGTWDPPSSAPAAERCDRPQRGRRREGLVRRDYHSGAWEFREAEGRHMWSDTGSYERESPGDVVKVFVPFAMNLASPCTV